MAIIRLPRENYNLLSARAWRFKSAHWYHLLTHTKLFVLSLSTQLKTLPQGLAPGQPGVLKLMRQLDQALFFDDTEACPCSTGELQRPSRLRGRYKETSRSFPQHSFIAKPYTQPGNHSGAHNSYALWNINNSLAGHKSNYRTRIH